MSNTHCRFCEITVKGLYLNCPKCGKWLPPGDGESVPPEEYELAETPPKTPSTTSKTVDLDELIMKLFDPKDPMKAPQFRQAIQQLIEKQVLEGRIDELERVAPIIPTTYRHTLALLEGDKLTSYNLRLQELLALQTNNKESES